MKFDPKTYGAYAFTAALPFAIYYVSPGYTLPHIDKAPWVSLPLLAFLGWRLNQTRILFSAAILFAAITYSPMGPAAKSLALPYSLLMVFSFAEAPLFSQRSLLRLALASFPLVFALAPESFDFLSRRSVFPHTAFLFPDAALIGLLLLALMSFLTRDHKIRPFMQGLALAAWPALLPTPIAALAACGIVLWAVFSMYWQRVYVDELTAIANRRALDEKLATLDSHYTLVMVDIDHFKNFNDTYGHDEGDNVLKLVARHLNDGSGGKAYRYGGEEFCLVFEGWAGEKSEAQANAIRETLAARKFIIRLPEKIRKKTSADDRGSLSGRSAKLQITASMGVASPDKNHTSPQSVIKLADECLYAAKEKGRNCVVRKN